MVAKELTDRGVRILIVFVLVWVACFGYKSFGCAKIEGPEMSPTIDSGKFIFTRPVATTADVAAEDVLLYELHNITEETRAGYGGRVKAMPGQMYEKLPTFGSTRQGHEPDAVNLPCPRDCFILIADAENVGKDYDSRRMGVIPLPAVKGKKW